MNPTRSLLPGNFVSEYELYARGYHFDDLYRDQYLPLGRRKGQLTFSWAIPNREALAWLLTLGPLIEIGAGLGYWASLLRRFGGDIVAYDQHPPTNDRHRNGYCRTFKGIEPTDEHVGVAFAEVLKGGPSRIRKHPDRSLFLCWPPFSDPMAERCLRLFKGKTVAYVGEGSGGCTGTENFHKMLAEAFEEERNICIPQWNCTHDSLTIYNRR